jgi:chemotaxis signal transduction protein
MNSDATDNHDPDNEVAGRKLQLVHAGLTQFGVFADEISAIVPWQEPSPLPHAPSAALGVVCIQGRMLTVLDLATLLATSDDVPGAPTHLLALRGDEQLALAVEGLGDVIQLAPDAFLAQQQAETPVYGVVQHEGAELRILNLNGLFPTALQGRQRRQRRF